MNEPITFADASPTLRKMPITDLLARLDVRTLITVTALIYLICTLAQLFVYRIHRNEPSLGKFVFANVQINLGLVLLALRGFIPDFFSIVIANGIILSGVAHLHHAVRSFYQRPTSHRTARVVFVLATPLFFYFSQIRPDYTIRVLLFSLPFILLCALIAKEFFRPTEHETQAAPRLVNGSMFAAVAIFHAMRLLLITGANFHGQGLPVIQSSSSLLQPSPLSALTWLVLIFTFGYWNVGLLLAISQKFLAQQSRLAITDGLTGILNRRGFELMAEKLLSERGSAHDFMLLLDIDHFKQVNDQHGHEGGDEVLRQVVLLLSRRLRRQDLIGRLGGEEFGILLHDSSAAQAWSVAERLRTTLQDSPIRHGTVAIQATVSIGVAQSGLDGDSFAKLFHSADQRLYQAKRSGRNRTIFHEPTPQPAA